MKIFTNYIKKVNYLLGVFILVVVAFLMASCGFVGKEFKQDQSLVKYRRQLQRLSDSIPGNINRIDAFKTIVSEVSEDATLITLRKKNKLLSEVYYFISNEYYELGSMKEALESSTLSIAFDKSNQYAYYNRACIYQELGIDSLAIDDYTSAILYDEQFIDSYYNRALLYEKRTDFQLAVEDYTRVIMSYPPYVADVYNNRGNVYQEMKFFDKAIEDYNKALAKDSTMSIVYCNRADTYLKKGNVEQAMSDYEEAIRIDTANTTLKDHIRLVQKQFGDR